MARESPSGPVYRDEAMASLGNQSSLVWLSKITNATEIVSSFIYPQNQNTISC
jgi:hypothetical protein